MLPLSTYHLTRKFLLRFLPILFPFFALGQSNDCATPTPLVSGITCTGTNGTLVGSTYVAITSPCDGNRPDVWYSFTAKSTLPTITVTSASNQKRVEIYTDVACGSMTQVGGCYGGGTDNFVPTVPLT